MLKPARLRLLFVASVCIASAAQAQSPALASASADAGATAGTVAYPATFFQPYNPVTARDMVLQVPGFRIEEGGDSRGFGGTAGNVLIDGNRPTTKDDDAGTMLGRIPAGRVERIELIRGDTGGLNLRGQAVVVNVVLRNDLQASGRWEGKLRTTENAGIVNPGMNVSGTAQWRGSQFSFGFDTGEERANKALGAEQLFTLDGLAELRDEFARSSGRTRGANLNTETNWGKALVHTNIKLGRRQLLDAEDSFRTALLPSRSSRLVLENKSTITDTVEAGGDIELPLTTTLTAKAILLHNRNHADTGSSLQVFDLYGPLRSHSLSAQQGRRNESIARLELDWSGWAGHLWEANIETAYNRLDSLALLQQSDGSGFRPVPLPGGNTDVAERRWEIDAADSWQRGRLSIESGVAAEFSTIRQQGDFSKQRSFTFVKPRLLLAWAPVASRQLRLRLQREVAQLDFNDFASSTNFADNQFALGNPDLKPDSTWVAAVAFEQRFSEIGVLSLTLFQHWITDVQDIVPLGGILEAPGNIGNGRRSGVETALTLPLDTVRVPGGRLDLKARWQDSRVTDPVTQRERELSSQPRYEFRLEFRQNFSTAKVAWGGMIALEPAVPFFGLDEYVANDNVADTVDMDVFIETTRWYGLRTRLQVGNAFNRTFQRDRIVYTGARDLTPLAFRELRNRTRGHSIEIAVTGNF